MEAIVLAGGFGTRLRAVVPDLPKPMAPVAGKPFLELVLAGMASQGFARVVLSLGYKADAISAYFGERFQGMELVYEVEDSPRGTGGAVRAALGRCCADHVFIFNGDTYLQLEIPEVEACWEQHREPIIVTREVDDTARYGRVQVEKDYVADFLEKGQGGPGLINAGCYVFPRDLLAGVAPQAESFSLEADFLAEAVRRGGFRSFTTRGMFIDIGIPEDYQRAQDELAHLAGPGHG